MTFLYLPASLSTSDVNEALHGFLLSKHRCFCFMGLWDGMELINQRASAVPPHSCNFKARSHTKKKAEKIGNLFREHPDDLTVPPACCPTWSPAPSPLFIPPPPFSDFHIPINVISPVPFPFLTNHFQSHLCFSPTPILLPLSSFHLCFPYPYPTLRCEPRLVHPGMKFNVLHVSQRIRNASAFSPWIEISALTPASSTSLLFFLLRMLLPGRFSE